MSIPEQIAADALREFYFSNTDPRDHTRTGTRELGRRVVAALSEAGVLVDRKAWDDLLAAKIALEAERDRLAARLAEVRGVRNELENSATAAGLSDAGGAYRRAVRLLNAALLPSEPQPAAQLEVDPATEIPATIETFEPPDHAWQYDVNKRWWVCVCGDSDCLLASTVIPHLPPVPAEKEQTE